MRRERPGEVQIVVGVQSMAFGAMTQYPEIPDRLAISGCSGGCGSRDSEYPPVLKDVPACLWWRQRRGVDRR